MHFRICKLKYFVVSNWVRHNVPYFKLAVRNSSAPSKKTHCSNSLLYCQCEPFFSLMKVSHFKTSNFDSVIKVNLVSGMSGMFKILLICFKNIILFHFVDKIDVKRDFLYILYEFSEFERTRASNCRTVIVYCYLNICFCKCLYNLQKSILKILQISIV